MKKIISLFQRNYDGDRLVRNEIVPGAEWVVAGEGVATRKYDGTCCLVRDGRLYKRYEVKKGKTPPPDFEPACEVDEVTGKQQGWVPVGGGPEDGYHRDAFCNQDDGTYELCGPKIQGNPEGFSTHVLIRHGATILHQVPRDFDGLKNYLETAGVTGIDLLHPWAHGIEGIVWHHPDGRMVKIKARDFGIKR